MKIPAKQVTIENVTLFEQLISSIVILIIVLSPLVFCYWLTDFINGLIEKHLKFHWWIGFHWWKSIIGLLFFIFSGSYVSMFWHYLMEKILFPNLSQFIIELDNSRK